MICNSPGNPHPVDTNIEKNTKNYDRVLKFINRRFI